MEVRGLGGALPLTASRAKGGGEDRGQLVGFLLQGANGRAGVCSPVRRMMRSHSSLSSASSATMASFETKRGRV